MDNLVNSLVNKSVGKLTNQLIIDGLRANPNMSQQQLSQTLGVSMQDIAGALNADAQKSGYQTSRVDNAYSGTSVTDIRDIGGGFNAYQDENGQTSGFSRVDPSKPGMIQLYGPNGELRGEQKITSTTQDMLRTLGPIALAAGGSMLAQGMLGAAGTGAVGTGTSSTLGTLGGLGAETAVAGMGTGTGLTMGGAGGLGGATGVSSLGGSLGSGLTTAGAGGLGGATGAAGLGGLGTGVGAGVGGMAAGNSLLGNAALGSTLAGASTLPAGSALSSLGAGGGSLLNTAGAAGSALGTTLGQGLGLSALGTGLGAIANQSGISNARDLINQYGTKAEGNLARSYADAQALNRANRGDLTSNYARTQNKLGNIYDQQVEFQQPYQAVGRAGSEALVENVPYFNKQFGTADLYSGLAPNYEFMLGQGQMANQRAGNMAGGALGGNALQGLQKYTQDYAGNAYQNAFKNFQDQRQNIYGNLSGMANIGLNSAGQLASLGNAYGSNLAGLSSNYGNNLTTSYGQGIGAANAYGLNTANLATGIGGALASNATASGANTSTALSNLGNAALFGSMLKAT